ncbi:MAG: FKBP-type peptidyl-prolyl cis-trans isomerase [Rhabdochlamydiaceae bacterium]
MKQIKLINLFAFFHVIAAFAFLSADNPQEGHNEEQEISVNLKDAKLDIAKISESFGHLIGKNIINIGFDFNMESLIQGIKNFSEGHPAPMNESECVQAISVAQETALKEKSLLNLKNAENFLKENQSKSDIHSIANNKIQFFIEKEGAGPSISDHSNPVLNYKGFYLDGRLFGDGKEESICLDQTIPGLKQGLIGMKEGEKRKIYIHPDLAYGENDFFIPNSLLTFEVECIKTDSLQKIQAPTSDETNLNENISKDVEPNSKN